ncbi:MAG: AI-2E family transporter [Candidatus Binatia bacterium]
MTREHLFTAFFFAVLAFLLYQLFLVFRSFLGPFAWAAVFALVFFPPYRLLLVRIGNAAVASLAMTLVIFVLVAVPVLTFGGVVIAQTQHFYSLVQEKAASGEARRWMDSLRENRLGQFVTRALPRDVRESVDLTDLGVRGAQAASQYLLMQLGGIARNVAGFLIDFTLMLIVLFFFFRDGRKLYFGFRDFLPMEPEHKDAIFGRLYETLSAVVQGMTVTAALQGALCGLAYWALGLPFALLATLASSVAAFIPVGGAAFVWVPAVIYFFVQGMWVRALILLVWGILVVSLIDNVARPMVVGSRTNIPTLFLFFGMLGGLEAYGVIGVFLGPVLLATAVAVLRIYREDYAESLREA